MSGVIAKLVIGGPDQFFCQILKFLAGSLATSGQKKSIPNPNFMPKQESPTLTPIPPLAKIWHQLYHGEDSISSDMVLTKKCLCQRITYPLGSTLTQAFLFMCCFQCKTVFLILKNRIDEDDNYIISAGNVLIVIMGNPPLPPKDSRPPPKTPHITRSPSIVGGRGALLVETMACCTQSYCGSSKQAMLAYNNQNVRGRGGEMMGGPGLLRERAVWGCGQGEDGSQGER